ncbi:MAG: 6-phosphogluconolactonase [Chlamydiales bacterium]|nr:6-phosphogluconolactonase [Chlamydiales bacterium]
MQKNPIVFDERRLIALPGGHDETIHFAVENWIETAIESIKDHDFFAVALSGGSTPKKIFQELAKRPDAIDWSKVYLFWGDERPVPVSHPESNYRMAIEEAGLEKLPIPKNQIYRMIAETDIEANAIGYEAIIQGKLGAHPFDLIMLGMGDDGHTASLFPHTRALNEKERLVVANHIPQKNTWRMTLTYACMNNARHICIYVLGAGKAEVLERVLTSKFNYEEYPSQNIGTKSNPALWIVDLDASKNLISHFK